MAACAACSQARALAAPSLPYDVSTQLKALQAAAVAQLRTDNYELALRCARALAEIAAAECGRGGGGSALAQATAKTAPFLAVNALLGLGPERAAEAGAELLEAARLAAQPATQELLLDSVGRCVRTGGFVPAADAVLALLRHSPERGDALLRYAELALQEGPAGRQAALQLLASDAALQALRAPAVAGGAAPPPAAAAARKRLAHALALLWNVAAALFEGKEYKAARETFAAVLSLMLPEDASRARAARAACLCHLALREPQQAARYIELADQLERGEGGGGGGCSVQTQFLRLKCALELSGDDEAAVAALDSFALCADMVRGAPMAERCAV